MADLNKKIQTGIQTEAAGSRFELRPIARHVHNGTDSPYVFQPILQYIGEFSSSGAKVMLPNGWTVTHNGTGSYTVTHNLGSTYYQVIPTVRTNIGVYASVYVLNQNYFTVRCFVPNGSGYDNSDASVGFVLTIVNNRSQTIPSYN